MDAKSQARFEILIAADRWAREIMRQDKILDPLEQKLFEAVMQYQRIIRSVVEIPTEIPRPPYIPSKELESYIDREPDTKRYSDIPTMPSPAQGIPAVNKEIIPLQLEDIEWTGK
jgi:hypothetical protein